MRIDSGPAEPTLCNMKTRDPDSPAARLEFARISAGFETAQAFSDKHGLKQPTYHNHESGKRGIKDATAKRYAKLLGNCDYRWIMTGLGRAPAGGAALVPHAQADQSLAVTPITLRLATAIPGAALSPDGEAAIRFYRDGVHGLTVEVTWDSLFSLETQIGKLRRSST